jgi:hypothetical protein
VVIAKILGKALVKTDVLMCSAQILSGNGRLHTVTPDDSTAKVRFRTQRIKMLQKTKVNDDLPDPDGPITMQVKGCLKLMSSPL